MITKLEEILNQTLKQLNYNYNVKIVKSNIEGTDFQCDDCRYDCGGIVFILVGG